MKDSEDTVSANFFFNFAEKSKAFFVWFSDFFRDDFFVGRFFTEDFKVMNKKSSSNTRVYTGQTIPKMRNPPLPQISTFSTNKHTFSGLTKMCLL